MVISIQELRKVEQQRQLERSQYSQNPVRFPWSLGQLSLPESSSAKPQGALKLARILYGN